MLANSPNFLSAYQIYASIAVRTVLASCQPLSNALSVKHMSLLALNDCNWICFLVGIFATKTSLNLFFLQLHKLLLGPGPNIHFVFPVSPAATTRVLNGFSIATAQQYLANSATNKANEPEITSDKERNNYLSNSIILIVTVFRIRCIVDDVSIDERSTHKPKEKDHGEVVEKDFVLTQRVRLLHKTTKVDEVRKK